MPGGDRTGPLGMGPMTGRAAGYCAGYNMPGYMNPVAGFGFGPGFGRGGGRAGGRGFGRGRGRGGGRGWRNWYYATGLPGWARAAQGAPAWGPGAWGPPAWGPQAWDPSMAPGQPPTPDVELDALKAQAEYFETSLADIKTRIGELESQQHQTDTE